MNSDEIYLKNEKCIKPFRDSFHDRLSHNFQQVRTTSRYNGTALECLPYTMDMTTTSTEIEAELIELYNLVEEKDHEIELIVANRVLLCRCCQPQCVQPLLS